MASRDPADLDPELQGIYANFLAECRMAGIDTLLICTHRSEREQADLFAQGRSRPGRIVTHARPGQSPHNAYRDGAPAALAFDVVPLVNGKISWDTNGKAILPWLRLGEIGHKLGLTWGGSFRSGLKDYPHFQLDRKATS